MVQFLSPNICLLSLLLMYAGRTLYFDNSVDNNFVWMFDLMSVIIYFRHN